MPLPTPRVKALGWAMFEVLDSADETQLDVNIELLDGYVDVLFMHVQYLPERYGAVSDGSTNDTGACQDCINACSAAGGGTVRLRPGRVYKHTGLTVLEKVSIEGHETELKINHATNASLLYSNVFLAYTPTTLSGVKFTAAVASTGANVQITAGQKLVLSRVAFNFSANSKGYCINSTHTDVGGELTLEDCRLELRSTGTTTTTANALYIAGGRCVVRGGRAVVAPAHDGDFINIAGGEVVLLGVCIDGSQHGVGGVQITQFIRITSATARLNLDHVTFIGSNGTGLEGGIRWDAACKIVETGTVWEGFTGAPYFTAGTILADGSRLCMRPKVRLTPAGDFTITDGYEHSVVRCTKASAPLCTPPQIYFPGQRHKMAILNASASTWSGGVGFVGADPSVGYAGTNIVSGFIEVFNLVATDLYTAGTFLWSIEPN